MDDKERLDTLRELLVESSPDKTPEEINILLGRILGASIDDKRSLIAAALKGGVPSGVKTYYKHTYALQLIEDIKHMMETGDILEYPYADYPNREPKTIYTYINDSFRYLADHCDDAAGSIKAFRNSVHVTRTKTAVIIKPKDALTSDSLVLKARRIKASEYVEDSCSKAQAKALEWKDKMLDWVNDPARKAGEVYEDNINLTPMEEQDLIELFEKDDNYGIFISKDKKSFKIRRLVD